MIEFTDVHIGFTQSLICIPSLELQKGKVYTLVGRNGAGKSTLLKTISRQIPPFSGKITLQGKDLMKLPKMELPKILSFVPSQFPEIDFMCAKEYVGMGRSPFTGMFGKMKPSDVSMVEKAMHLLSIDHLSEKSTSILSDGEKQLVSIARAIAQEADYILLDEPTAFLDYENKLLVMDRLKEIAMNLSKCIVFSSHDLDLCAEMKSIFLILDTHEQKIIELENVGTKEIVLRAFSGTRPNSGY